MSKLMITTVGTDIINKISNEKIIIGKEYFNSVVKGLANGIPLNPETESKVIDQIADKIKEKIDDNVSFRLLPAEIASLMAFNNDDNYGLSSKDKIALFRSDTEDGKFCANVNKIILNELGWCKVPEPTKIAGLKTKTTGETGDISENFKNAGLKNLNIEVKKLLENPDYDDNYFNITGGFKALIPFSTIIAFNNDMRLIYLYERSDDLIFIRRPEKFNCPIDVVIEGMEVRKPRQRLA
jgi:putative CRISPR-associated protein (TIGR02619 family)